MALSKRVQVLMEPSEFQQLEEIARQQQRPVGELLRSAARQAYLEGPEARRQALQDLLELRLAAPPTDLSATLVATRHPAPIPERGA